MPSRRSSNGSSPRARDDLLHCSVGDGRNIGDCPLMPYILRNEGIELAASDRVHRDAMLTCEIPQFVDAAAAHAVGEQNAVDAAPCLDRLDNGMTSRQDGRGLFLLRHSIALCMLFFHRIHLLRHQPRGINASSHGSSATMRSRIRSIISLISHCAPGVVTRFS